MTPTAWGIVLGGFVGLGAWLVLDRLVSARHTSLAVRVAPYLRDLSTTGSPAAAPPTPRRRSSRSSVRSCGERPSSSRRCSAEPRLSSDGSTAVGSR